MLRESNQQEIISATFKMLPFKNKILNEIPPLYIFAHCYLTL